MARVVHPIEKQSYEILRARVDTSGLPPWTRAVVERVIHASADITYLPDIVCEEADLAAAAAALRRVLGITRAAAGIRVAGSEVGPGAVWVIGTAPTALADLLARGPAPALIMGCRWASWEPSKQNRRCGTAGCPRSPTSARRAVPQSPRPPLTP